MLKLMFSALYLEGLCFCRALSTGGTTTCDIRGIAASDTSGGVVRSLDVSWREF